MSKKRKKLERMIARRVLLEERLIKANQLARLFSSALSELRTEIDRLTYTKQDEVYSTVFLPVERQWENRRDCRSVPERVRLAA